MSTRFILQESLLVKLEKWNPQHSDRNTCKLILYFFFFFQISKWSYSSGILVGSFNDHDSNIHSQPRCVSNIQSYEIHNKLRGIPRFTDQDKLRDTKGLPCGRIFPEVHPAFLQCYVSVHEISRDVVKYNG